MRFLSLSVIHARMAARQRAIWVASLLLALLSMGVAVNTGLPFETGDVADLVFLAQMLAMLPPVAYAAAFTDLAAEPERLGISEVEASAPVRPMELTVARVVGALAVMTSPSAALLLFCAAGQMLHGNVWGSVAGDSPVRRGGASRCLCCCGAVGAGGLVAAEDRRAHRLRRRMAGYAVRMFVQGCSGFRRRRAVPYRERSARAGVLRIPAVPRLSGAGSRRCAFRSAGPARVQVRRCGGASGPRPRPSPAGARTAVTDEPPLRIERTPMFISLDRLARTSTRSPAPSTTLRSTCLRA